MNEKEKETQPTKEAAPESSATAKENAADAIKRAALKGLDLTPEEEQAALEILEQANMPIEFDNKDFKLGPQEIDIRKLNERNYRQMIFRTLIVQGVWLRNMSRSLLDVCNLLFVLLDKMGVKNIVKESDEVLVKIHKEQLKAQEEALKAKAEAKPEEDNKKN